MTIKDLRNGDIILQRSGTIGLVLVKNGDSYIIYPESGFDEIDVAYNDDLTDFANGPAFDIMRVYRAEHGMISFADYEEGEIIYNRDEDWARP